MSSQRSLNSGQSRQRYNSTYVKLSAERDNHSDLYDVHGQSTKVQPHYNLNLQTLLPNQQSLPKQIPKQIITINPQQVKVKIPSQLQKSRMEQILSRAVRVPKEVNGIMNQPFGYDQTKYTFKNDNDWNLKESTSFLGCCSCAGEVQRQVYLSPSQLVSKGYFYKSLKTEPRSLKFQKQFKKGQQSKNNRSFFRNKEEQE